MNKEWMKTTMDDIRMTDEKKSELWDGIVQKADHRRYLKHRVAAAAALLILLLIPSGVYAASAFQWKWDEETPNNKELDVNFKSEFGSLEAEGFRFEVKKAFCDESLGIAYYYVAVTDISGEGRNPKNYTWNCDSLQQVGDVTYSISMKQSTGGAYRYDEENSTKKTAYYYMEEELSNNADREDMYQIEIEFDRLTKVDNHEDGQRKEGLLIGEKTITIQNVIAMPSLTWKIEGGDVTEEVRVSSIAARLKESNHSRLEIVLNDGTEIKDYFDYHKSELGKDGTIPSGPGKRSFYTKDAGTEPGTLYRFDYTDIDSISGIRLDGVFYPVSKAKRSDE